jgi:hypothetical protein
MNKKGFVSMHAGVFFVVGLILGAVAMWYLMSNGIIPI